MFVLALALSIKALAQPQELPSSGAPPRRTFDFVLTTMKGEPRLVSSLWSNKPVSIIIGSYTCPQFRKKIGAFDELLQEFSNRVDFLVLYVQEAHPTTGSSPYPQLESATKQNEHDGVLFQQPKTVQERRALASRCATALKIKATVLVDGIDNAGWEAFGKAPNSAFLVQTGGKVVEQEKWFDPVRMRIAITKLLNPN